MKHKNVRKVGYAPAVAAVSAVFSAAAPLVSAAGLVMSGVSFFQQKKATGQAAEATKRQSDLQNRLNEVNAQRARLNAIREARIKRAQILTSTTGAGLGATGTSSSVGGIGAVSTQEATNVQAINKQQGFGQAIGAAQTDYYTAAGEAKGWQDIGSISGSIFKESGGFDSLKKFGTMFDTGVKT
jgi:hypothetical protein